MNNSPRNIGEKSDDCNQNSPKKLSAQDIISSDVSVRAKKSSAAIYPNNNQIRINKRETKEKKVVLK
jgi:hypothetical protein